MCPFFTPQNTWFAGDKYKILVESHSPGRWKCRGRRSLEERRRSSYCSSWPVGRTEIVKDHHHAAHHQHHHYHHHHHHHHQAAPLGQYGGLRLSKIIMLIIIIIMLIMMLLLARREDWNCQRSDEECIDEQKALLPNNPTSSKFVIDHWVITDQAPSHTVFKFWFNKSDPLPRPRPYPDLLPFFHWPLT